MSINFVTLQGLTIPEGVVTQIADASGRVLWSAVDPVATITFGDMPNNIYTYVEIDGVKYTGATTSAVGYSKVASGTVVEVPIGITIICSAHLSGCDNDGCKSGTGVIYLNDSAVNRATSYYTHTVTYSYTVTRNVTIRATGTYKECSECEKGDILNTNLYITEE